MPTKYETNVSEYFTLPNPALQAYFGHVRKGQPNIYRTSWFKDVPLDDILAQWCKELEPLRDEWPTLFDYEMDQAKKVGPLSVMKPLKERLPDIDHYYDDILKSSTPVNPRAIKAVMSEWSAVPPLRIRGQKKTVECMKKSTNSGSPFFTRRRNVVDETVPFEIVLNDPFVVQILPQDSWLSCAVLGWRGQEGGPDPSDVKQRVVWMFPFSINVAELQLYQVLIEAAQRSNLIPAWVSMDEVDMTITKLFDTKGKNDLIVCTDFSKFDQHFNKQLQTASAAIIHHIFRNCPHIENWLHDVYPIKYMIPIMIDTDKIRTGEHGMASGSGGTNADETLAHRALQYEVAISQNARLNPNSQCLGDDGILSYPGITVKDVVNSYISHGLDMNPDKQYASTDDCIYLRRWHHKNYRADGVCVGVYPTCRALGRLAEQERFYDPDIWSREMVALRQLSILENIKFHPLREKFVAFCIKGDRYRLGLDIPGFFEKLERIVDKATEVIPDFLGYTRSEMSSEIGINDWWIVKYLKSLR